MNAELDTYIRSELQDLGWVVKSPSRDEAGQVWTRTQYKAEPEIVSRLNGYRPRSIVRLQENQLWVIGADEDRESLGQTLSATEAHVARRLSADGEFTVPLISGVAGNDDTGYEVRTKLLVNNRYRTVVINGSEATGLLDPSPVAKLVESGSHVLKDLVVNEELFLKKAERINSHLHLGGINKNDRARVMAALLLALSEPGDVRSGESLTLLVRDINSRTSAALRRHDKASFYRFVEVHPPTSGENHDGYRRAIIRTVQELTNINIRSAINSGTDVLGKFYEVFLKYGNGAREIGIVLTPRHLTKFAVETLGVGANDIVLDPACGTGGFLVAAFDHVRRTSTPKTIERFRRANLFGIERESSVAALAVVNMIFRGDGNTNIVEGNCFSRYLRSASAEGRPTAEYVTERPTRDQGPVTRVFMNPPFALKQSQEHEYQFIEQALCNMADGGLLFAIVPTSVMVEGGQAADWRRLSLLSRNTLLAVISMTRDVFYPVDVTPVALIVRKGTPHPKSQGVFWARVQRDGFEKSKRRRVASPASVPNDLLTIQPLLEQFIHGHADVSPIPGLIAVTTIDKTDPNLELVPEAFLDSALPDLTTLMTRLDHQVRENAEVLVALDFRFGAHGQATIVDAARRAPSLHVSTLLSAPHCLRPFALDDLFELSAGDFHSLNDLEPGDVPVITCADEGASRVSGYAVSRHHQYRDCLTIAFNGYPLTAQIHPYCFGAKDDVAVARPRSSLPIEAVVFIQMALNAERWRFSYARKCFMAKLRRQTLMLPAKEDGTLDVEYMVQAVQAQPYWWFLSPRLAHWRPWRWGDDERTSEEVPDIGLLYEGVDERSVADMLRSHPGIRGILAEAGAHIAGHFGSQSRVRLYTEQETDGGQLLYAMIVAPDSDADLLASLNRFDDWWLSKPTSEPIVFTVGRS